MSIRRVPIALIGFGNASRRLAELLIDRAALIEEKYHSEIICTAIATARHGSVVGSAPIDLAIALELVRRDKPLTLLPGVLPVENALQAIDRSGAEVVVETTPLNIKDGEPALTHIRWALESGKHVVTANKGPLAFAARELRALAAERSLCLRYESTVMDGAPIFNLFSRTLPLVEVKSMRGIINSTTNFILTAMEQGSSYASALAEAEARGVAEADPSLDVDGWDAAVKAALLANCLMGADIKPDKVSRIGIRDLDCASLQAARHRGEKIRLVTRIERRSGQVDARVSPEAIPISDLLFAVDNFSNALIFETDLMGTIAVVEQHPDLTQTAYGLLSDLISIL